MRLAPASVWKGKTTKGINREPRAGTELRKMFDLFKANPGIPILFSMRRGHRLGRKFADLRDYYGLDIRSIPNCHHKCLVGEWVDEKYVDYVAQKISG